MKETDVATIDAAGRLVLPKRLRESAGLVPGHPLRISLTDDGRLEIEAIVPPARLERRGRWWVALPPEGAPELDERVVEGVRRALREPLHGD
jgi:AbrB family looped-hinge helix DNA binding protein